ncbi:MAG: MBL fold metallo-hydrolase [Clostridia bacterium]|nr:MBL fold metallo-hydrolase [Clostridia bacterium]
MERLTAIWKQCTASILALFCFLFPNLTAQRILRSSVLPPASEDAAGTDRIHFLRTGTSDAILLESDGHFAMVDAGEDSDNPRNFDWLSFGGHENEVLAYLKANAADRDGKVHLDFVLGTHAHSDHIGGFDTLILDPDVTVGRAYLKEYDSAKVNTYELEQWDNQEVYDQMVAALNERNVPIVSHPDAEPFSFGHFTVTLFNTDDPENPERVGENDNSLGVLLEKNGTRIFLAGDMDNYTGDEDRLAPAIGKVHLLKPGHHCLAGSSTENFIKTLLPDACVIMNDKEIVNSKTLAGIVKICRHKNVYLTGNENGVLAVIGDNGDISCYGQIFKDYYGTNLNG